MSNIINSIAHHVVDDAEKLITLMFPNDQARSNAGEKFKDALDSPDAKKTAYESVRDIAMHVQSTRRRFVDVADDMVAFDAQKFKDKQGNVVLLGPKWKALVHVCRLLDLLDGLD